MKHLFYFVKYNLIRQLRTNRFLLTIAISILFAFICVPSAANGYEVFYLGGVRGIYNSAWLGALAASLSMIVLWLPGFFMLRNQISEDERNKLGQIIASTPMSKLSYIGSIAISNFVVLLVLELIFVFSLMVMQLIRHESMTIQLMGFLKPLLFITMPSLFLVAVLTVFFDVIPVLKKTFGNVLIFFVWIAFTIFSVDMPDNKFDLFGIGITLKQMISGARTFFPDISTETGSFGYYPLNQPSPTFVWNGLQWDAAFIASRLVWIALGIVIIVISSCIFNRFKEKQRPVKASFMPDNVSGKTALKEYTNTVIPLTPSKKAKGGLFFRILKGEIKVMFANLPKWWYLCLLAAIILPFAITSGANSFWFSVVTLLPMSIWSQMGCREKYNFTDQIVYSCCSKYKKYLATLFAGIVISFIASSGVLINLLLHHNIVNFFGWLVGVFFIPCLAILLGDLTKNTKLFEAIFIAWFYFGPINNMPKLDFLSIRDNNVYLYLILTGVLLALGLFSQRLHEKHVL